MIKVCDHWLISIYKIFTVMKIWIVVFWDMTPSSLVGSYQRFEGTFLG
jgi:hypothetical protein